MFPFNSELSIALILAAVATFQLNKMRIAEQKKVFDCTLRAIADLVEQLFILCDVGSERFLVILMAEEN